MIDKIKKTRFNVGDRVWINPQESEYGILEIIGNTLYGEEKLANPSDGWDEKMLSLSYPR